ncbi:DNA end-binding protein Ku [Heliophilum fasciatum]|uniref:Non-homologous end joining protein Ku n=2 Tax=Heliophilum fasciatum TaxID=35700 RepID=A0A4V2SW19_9FIRM|nr:DNA end-binding protein Ku [Heliophilum fasciatum]
MRSMWTGAISFGLIHIPVKLFAATEDKDVRFNWLHKECNSPVQYKKHCPHCNKEVGQDDLVKGFEYEKGRFVLIADEELEALAPEGTRTIDIKSFVHLKEIDPIYFAKTYYLAPDGRGQKAFALLRAALQEADRLALAKVVLRAKESLAAVRVYKEGLAMHLMLFPEEIRGLEGLGDIGVGMAIDAKEKTMALQLIDSLTEPWEPVKWHNEYQTRVRELIDAKIQGQTPVEAPRVAATGNVIDLMAALKASIEQAKEKQAKPPAPPTTKKRQKTS